MKSFEPKDLLIVILFLTVIVLLSIREPAIYTAEATVTLLPDESQKEENLSSITTVTSKLHEGMQRKEAERILEKEWKYTLSTKWASGENARYQHKEIKEYNLYIWYDWKDISEERVKNGGLLYLSSDDQEIIKPVEIKRHKETEK